MTIDEKAFDAACNEIGLADTGGVVELIDSGNLRAFLAKYLAVEREQVEQRLADEDTRSPTPTPRERTEQP